MKQSLIAGLFLQFISIVAWSQAPVSLKEEYRHFIESNDSFHQEIKAHFYMKQKRIINYVIIEDTSKSGTTLSTRYELSDSLKTVIKTNKDKDYIICKPVYYNDSIYSRVYIINKNTLKSEPELYCEFFIYMKIDVPFNKIDKYYFRRIRI